MTAFARQHKLGAMTDSAETEAAEPEQPEPKGDALSPLHASILQFESRPWAHPGVKDEAIRVELALTSARYYQLLNAAIESPAAVRHDPMLVRRLRRIRDGRARGISAGTEPDGL